MSKSMSIPFSGGQGGWRGSRSAVHDVLGGVLVLVLWVALWTSVWAAVAGPLSPVERERAAEWRSWTRGSRFRARHSAGAGPTRIR